jgi:hypothetical protein
MATAKPLMSLDNRSLPMAKPLPHHKRFRQKGKPGFCLMVRRRTCAVSNHHPSPLILRDAAKKPLLRMRTAGVERAFTLFQTRDFRCESANSRRDTPELCMNFPPSPIRGRREAGRPMRPIAACAMVVVERTRVSQVTPESPGTPRAMVLTASCVLSPATGLSCHRRPRKMLPANLMPASGHQDHTPSPSASSAFVKGAISVHRSPSRVDDVAQRPSFGSGWQII